MKTLIKSPTQSFTGSTEGTMASDLSGNVSTFLTKTKLPSVSEITTPSTCLKNNLDQETQNTVRLTHNSKVLI